MSPDDALPPVEPPSASFLLQLFIVPGIIVVAVVMVWMLFTWLAHKGDDPRQYVKALQRSSANRWQVAVTLASVMQDKRHGAFKRDPQAAAELARLLDEEIAAGSMEENQVTLRVFLARTLGEFCIPDVLPVLLKAATTARQPEEKHVRQAAIEAIAVLAQNMSQEQPPQKLHDSALTETMLALSRDDDPAVRYRAAFALGLMGDDVFLDRLERMIEDVNPDVRYNAATGLSRYGNERAIVVLEEMLDPTQSAGMNQEAEAADRPAKQVNILLNAMRATQQLAARNPQADIAPLRAAIEKLTKSKLPRPVVLEAEQTLIRLGTPAEAATN